MPTRSLLIATCLLSLAGTARAADEAPREFFFKDGDSPIVFVGDSITEQRMYTTLIESYVLSRFPTWTVTFRNAGWSGDTSWMGLRGGFDNGMKRDLLPLKPKAVTVDYGMNDARSAQWTFPQYVDCLGKFADQLHEAGARVALLTPSPEEKYEPGQPGGSAYNVTLAKYADTAREIAAKHQASFADQYTPFIDVIAKGRSRGVLGAAGDPRLIPDAVHPNWAGHLVMAASILKGLGAPALVSRCVVDAGTKAIAAQEGCRCEIVPVAHGIGLRRVDDALPWPIPPEAAPALAIPEFTALADLSRYELTVTGLKPGRYDVTIDESPVATLSADELAAGANLTMRCGAIGEQGQRLIGKIIEKNNVFFERWRTVQLWQSPAWLKELDVEAKRAAELARLDARIAALEGEIDALRKPAPHTFVIAPAAPARPLGATLNPKQPSGVSLTWRQEDAAATGTAIERADGDGAFKEVARVATGVTTWNDASAGSADATYRLRTLAADAISAPSLAVSARLASANGLLGVYFKGKDLAERASERVDAGIAFPSGPTGVDGIGGEQYSVRWSGTVTAPGNGTYTFTATADDGVRLWIDGKPIVDQWRDQGPTPCAGQAALKAGQPSDVVLEFYQGGGGAAITLEWSGPGVEKQVVPAAVLKPARWTK